MPNSLQFNEHLFLLAGVVLSLSGIVYAMYDLFQTRALLRRAEREARGLAYRQETACVCAEQQAEQIIEAIWPEEVL